MTLMLCLLMSQGTPVRADDLDALVEWVDGAARPRKESPRHVLWTQTSAPEWNGLRFGDSKAAGLRHLKATFKKDLEAGSLLVQGGGRASALKPGAAGDPADEAQWIPGQRLGGEAAVGKEYALWTFPPGTSTRALRFSQTSASSEKDYAGWLGGAWLLPGRYADLARAAAPSSRANDHHAAKLVNGRHDDWGPWDNTTEAMTSVAERPEWILLAWPAEVRLSGLCALGAGFGDGEVAAYTGPADRHPREAADGDWTSIRTFTGFKSQYPRTMSPNWIDFGREVKTRAVRLRLTKVTSEDHPHMKGNTKDGTRVWLHELLALSPLGDAALASAAVKAPEAEHPPIPVKFTLPEPGFVTLVIEDAEGRRVRNLVSETPFPAGENTAWWDGLDDLGRDRGAAGHAIYHIPGQAVAPGAYRVRGLRRGGIDLLYEMSVYNSGHPAWATADRSGGWLADHSPPSDVLFVPTDAGPQIWIASHVAEGGDGLVMIDLDGKKVGAIRWLGGNWTGASHLARDGKQVYTAAGWEQDKDKKKGDIRLMKIDAKGGAKRVVAFPLDDRKDAEVGGLAVRDGLLAVSLPKRNEVALVDVAAEKILGVNQVEDPKGLAFEKGALLAISGKKVVRYAIEGGSLVKPKDVVALQEPSGIALDAEGRLYVSDRGTSHQVHVFTPDGKPLRTIGTAGAPALGAYDPSRMTEPSGLTVAPDGTVWVAEHSYQPKRISAWSDKLVKAFYGPPEYGGGGQIDPKDKTRFYYNGMEFKLDWEKGTNTLVGVFYRPGADGFAHPKGHHADGPPQQAIYANGKQYMSNSFNSNPTNGTSMVFLWELQGGRAKPVAAVGQTSHWDRFKPSKESTTFAWNDRNGDGKATDDEIATKPGRAGGLVVHDDLSIVSSQGWRLAYPYDLAKAEKVVEGTQPGLSSGGDQAMTAGDGWTILTIGPKPFGADSLAGVKDGKPLWSYPSLWPGLHASHNAPLPTFPGQLLGTTRLLGGFVPTPAGELWAVNGNMGNVYLFTTDGLFVATLWKDGRLASWAMPAAIRGMSVKDASLHTEDFWPTITRTASGETYITVGVNTTSTIVRVTGLETLKRLPPSTVTVTNADLAACADYFVKRDLARASREGTGTLEVSLRKTAPEVDGKLEDWAGAAWVTIDSRTKQVGDWGHEELKTRAAVAVAGDRLYAAFRTGDEGLLRNTAEALPMLFKTGGALDLVIGADPAADPKREKPAAGDVRLIVTRAKDKTVAALYRAVVPGTSNPLPFSSPWRTVTIDRVDDVSADVKLASEKGGLYEFSIPLATLGLKPGREIRGDVGLLRGNGFQTLQRVYWQNKATGLTADVPGEAMLTPRLWGRWVFIPEK
ncbi:MAG TPA: hypothetical protein VF950_11805 [Planctomycetota bacterium]